jgi:hypothetical protein
MIEFIPAYDDATLANMRVIAPLLQPGALTGSGPGAVTLRRALLDAPGGGAAEAALLGALFSHVRDLCWQAADSRPSIGIIDLIWEMVGEIESAMLEIESSNLTFFCLFSMRNRLRLWCPGAASPLKHPEATDPPLY